MVVLGSGVGSGSFEEVLGCSGEGEGGGAGFGDSLVGTGSDALELEVALRA